MPQQASRWLVTGANGQLGRSILALAKGAGVEAIGSPHEELDIADPAGIERALRELRPEVVLNAAGFTQVDACESQREEAWRVNAQAPGALARACADRALLIHISTDYVFAGRGGEPIPEDAPTEPLSEYGRSKLAGEEAVQGAGGEHLIVRTQWLFGPGPNFVRTILARAERGGELRVVTDEVGRPTWAGSLASALLDVARKPLRGTLHLANCGVASRHEFACEIVREGARRGLVPELRVARIKRADLGRPAARPEHAVLDLERASRAGVELPHWREALALYLDAEEEGRDA